MLSATDAAYTASPHTGLLSLTSLTVTLTVANEVRPPESVAVMVKEYASCDSRSSRALVEITPVFSWTVKVTLSAPVLKYKTSILEQLYRVVSCQISKAKSGLGSKDTLNNGLLR